MPPSARKKLEMRSSFNHPTYNDLWVLDCLGSKENGFFVEVGARGGVEYSTTYMLEKDFGWKGVLVEPQKELFDSCVENRPNSQCFNFCCYKYDGFCDFVFSKEEKYVGHGGIPQHITIPHKKLRVEIDSPTSLPCKTLESILVDADSPKNIDYLSLDTEGSELSILSTFDFNNYNINLISVEGDECDDIILSNGFKRVKNPHNLKAPWESYYVSQW